MGVNEDKKFIHCCSCCVVSRGGCDDDVKVEWQSHLCIFNGSQAHSRLAQTIECRKFLLRHLSAVVVVDRPSHNGKLNLLRSP